MTGRVGPRPGHDRLLHPPRRSRRRGHRVGVPYRLLVVDDDPDYRLLVGLALDGQPDLALVGEAASSRRPSAAGRIQPDLVLLDLLLLGDATARSTLARAWPRRRPDAPVVVTSAFAEGDGRVSAPVRAAGRSATSPRRCRPAAWPRRSSCWRGWSTRSAARARRGRRPAVARAPQRRPGPPLRRGDPRPVGVRRAARHGEAAGQRAGRQRRRLRPVRRRGRGAAAPRPAADRGGRPVGRLDPAAGAHRPTAARAGASPWSSRWPWPGASPPRRGGKAVWFELARPDSAGDGPDGRDRQRRSGLRYRRMVSVGSHG